VHHWLEIKAENMPVNEPVFDIEQDSLGFMWFATGSGLYRYDGMRFIRLHSNEKQRTMPAYSFSHLSFIDGKIWSIADNQKLVVTDITNLQSSVVYLFDPQKEGIPMTLATTGQKEITVSTSLNSLFKFNTRNQSPFWNKDFFRKGYVIQCLLETENTLLLGTRARGLCTMQRNGDFKLKASQDSFPYPGYSIESIICFSDTLILYAGWDNAVHFADKQGRSLGYKVFDESGKLSFKGNEALSLVQINDSIVWVGSKSNGIYSLNIFTGISRQIRGSNFQGDRVYCLYKDSKSRIWAGTESGIQLYDKKFDLFEVNVLPNKYSDGIDPRIFSMEAKSQQVFLGTNQGLFIHENGQYQLINFPSTEQEEGIYSMCFYFNELYLGTARALYKYNFQEKRIKSGITKLAKEINQNALDPRSLISTRFSKLVSDTFSQKPKIIGTLPGYGFIFYRPQDGSYLNSAVLSNQTKYGAFIQSILIDQEGRLTAADRETGIYLNIQQTFETFTYSLYNQEGDSTGAIEVEREVLHSDNYYDLLELIPGERSKISFIEKHKINNNNLFWLGVKNKGLYLVQFSDTLSITRIAPEIQNPQALCVDVFGRLWIAEHGVIWLYNPGNHVLNRFGASYGIPDQVFTTGFVKNNSGEIVIAAGNIWIKFNPSKVLPQQKFLPIKLIQTGSLERLNIPFNNAGEIELHESETGINFEFTSLEYSDPFSVHYSYLIEGFQDKWLPLGNGARLQISKFPPGKYVLRIQSSDFMGNAIADQLIIPLKVQPYWFNSLVFKIALVVVLLLIVYLVYRFRLKQILRLQRVRDQIARDLHDDIGSTLGAINLYASAAKMSLERNQNEKAQEILNKIGNNARETSLHMSDIIWSVNPEKDDTGDLFERIGNFANDYLKESVYSFDMIVDSNAKGLAIGTEKRRNIYLILKECLHNSVKYANGTAINLSVLRNGRQLTILYEDNGIGFDQNETDSFNGNGLLNMKRRAEAIHAECSIRSSLGNGIQIKLIIVL